MSNSVEDLQMLRLIRAFQKLTDQGTRRMVLLYVEDQVSEAASRGTGRVLHQVLAWDWQQHNRRFVVVGLQTCKAKAYFASRRRNPMRLALPYLGIGLCASLAAWMSVMLFY
ncbi:hypothetical protein ACVWWK_006401 [Bradyrhizobium sp. LB9.1b]